MKTKTQVVMLSLLASTLILGFLCITPASTQDLYGGTLVSPLPSDPPETFIYTRASTWSFYFLWPIYDSLVMTSPDNLPVPHYAERWELDETGLIWTVYLVQNGSWHDGTPFTSADVEFTYEHCIDAEYGRWSDLWMSVDHTEVVDDYTIRMHLQDLYPPFVTEVLTYPIVPKHVFESIVADPDFDPLTYAPPLEVLQVGNGPFVLDEYVVASHVKYVAFEDYFRGRPYPDVLLMPIITSPDAMLLSLLAGEVDVHTWTVPVEAMASLVTTPDIGIHIYKSGTIYHWGMNNMIFPFKVKKFRQAMGHCVNKVEIVDVLLHGYGRPGRFGVYPSTDMWPQWLNEDPKCGVTAYEFNLTMAADILDGLGWVDDDGDGWREGTDPDTGERKTIEFDIGPPLYDPVRVRSAELIADWLSQIPGGGVKATVVYEEWGTLWSRIIQPWDSEFKVDSWLLGSGMGIGDPDILRFRFHSIKTPNPNYYYFLNATFDQLADAQAKEVDPDARAEIIRQMQEILAEEVPFIVLYHRNFISVYRTDKWAGWVKGVQAGVEEKSWPWSWVHCYLKELTVLKPISVELQEFPAPEVTEGETISFKVKLTDPDGNAITNALAGAFVTGVPETYTLQHLGGGVYATTITASGVGWITQPYTLKATFSAPGFEEETTVMNFELTALPTPTHALNVFSTPVTGVSFTLDGASRTTPYSANLNEGTYTVVMPSTTTIGGTSYDFVNWEDGSTGTSRTVNLTSDKTITATYEAGPTPPTFWEAYGMTVVLVVVVVAIVGIAATFYMTRRR